MRRDLRFDRYYPHPPEKVWRALTDARAIAQWLMPNDFEPKLGHHFQFRSKPVGGWDGIVNCEVLELDPPRRLVYTWTSNMLDTRVAWRLEPEGTGTRLRLEHTGFDGFRAWMISHILGSGWKSRILAELGAVVARMEMADWGGVGGDGAVRQA
jgi:uncharacterized protein YndB with AHSA1/START domain